MRLEDGIDQSPGFCRGFQTPPLGEQDGSKSAATFRQGKLATQTLGVAVACSHLPDGQRALAFAFSQVALSVSTIFSFSRNLLHPHPCHVPHLDKLVLPVAAIPLPRFMNLTVVELGERCYRSTRWAEIATVSSHTPSLAHRTGAAKRVVKNRIAGNKVRGDARDIRQCHVIGVGPGALVARLRLQPLMPECTRTAIANSSLLLGMRRLGLSPRSVGDRGLLRGRGHRVPTPRPRLMGSSQVRDL